MTSLFQFQLPEAGYPTQSENFLFMQ